MAKKNVVESAAEAAARIPNCTEAMVKRAKSLGCLAFTQGNRINLDVLDAWLKVPANLEAMKVSAAVLTLKDQKLNEEIRKLRISNDIKEKILMPVAERDNEFRETFRSVQSELFTIPPRAPELTGLPAAEIEKRLRQMLIDALRALKEMANEPKAAPA